MKRKWTTRAIALIVVVDFLVAINLIQADIIAHLTINQRHTPPALKTLGVYAITQNTPNYNPNDVDLWVQDPQGNTAYYASEQAGLMNLQHDVIPGTTDYNGHGDPCDCEETIIRGTIPGTYTVNVVMYDQIDSKSEPITITLWKLHGVVMEKQRVVQLQKVGQQITAFRFTLNKSGDVVGYSYQPVDLVNTQ